MRGIFPAAAIIFLFTVPGISSAARIAGNTAGTYDILVCDGSCSFRDATNVIVKGQIVLFEKPLETSDLQRFDESRFSHHFGEAINGCFTLETLRKSSIYAGGENIGVTSWSEQAGHLRFSLYHSPDAGYSVTVERTGSGLTGSGSSWGAGIAAPEHPSKEIVIARRTGAARISNCTFQTAEEHEFRRLLADPARNEVFAIEDEYEQKLLSELQSSPSARDWAMAGWMRKSSDGESQILRARAAAPEDPLIQWLTVIRTHADAVNVVGNGASPGFTFQYRELSNSALAQLQRAEPGNASLWLMSLRDAVHRRDTSAADAALARLASSEYYDDHAAELLKTQLKLYQSHPLPAQFFGAVARLDPGWKLNGAFTQDAAPYYENHYPFADLGIKNLFYMPVESGMHELFVICRQSDGSETRKDACVKSARLLSARAHRIEVRDQAFMLLSTINDFASDDVKQVRVHAWIEAQFYEIHPRSAGSQRPFVHDEIGFINDWIDSSDEFAAMQRAIVRAGKALEPPEDFQLKEAWYGNFERARAKGRAQTGAVGPEKDP
jgi:hypothetical protein